MQPNRCSPTNPYIRVRKQELEEMTGENVFSTFYDSLKGIREHHRRFSDHEEPQETEIKREFGGSVCVCVCVCVCV